MKTPRYLRFIQALVLAAAVPACGVDVDAASANPAGNTEASKTPSAFTRDPAALAIQDAGDALDAGAKGPFSSGPIVPPHQASAV